MISVGHHVWTAFVALGIGMALRLRQHWGRKAYLLPGFLFLWAVFDYGTYNASLDGLSPAVEFLYFLTGYGHFYKWAFVAALIIAVLWDYRRCCPTPVPSPPARHRLPAESDRLHPLLVAGVAQTAPAGSRRGGDGASCGAGD